MPTLAIVLVLTAALFHTLRDFTTKQTSDKLLFVWWISLISQCMLAPISLYFLFTTQPSWGALGFAAAMGLVHSSYWMFYAKAYEKGDISHVYPIIHSAPAFVLIFGVLFLAEDPSWNGVLGILLTTCGLYFINLKKVSFKTLLEPFAAIFREEHVQFAFLALIMVVATNLLDKRAVTELHPMVYVFFMSISGLTCFTFFIRKKVRSNWLRPWQKERGKALAGALFGSINYPLTLFALQLTHASYVAGLKQVGVVFASILGVVFLKERLSLLRVCSALLIFLGAVLIAL